jgi:uncharacterized membrane protein
VAASSYSTLFGIPLSAFGLLFYLSIFKIALHMRYQLLEKVGLGMLRPFLPQMLLVASTLGFICSAYFTYLQAFVINAWCMYCVISACLSTIIFIATLVGVQERTVE